MGVSDWKTVEQDDINTFAKLTGDEQWIHVDPERAKETAVGTTDPARLPHPRHVHRPALVGVRGRGLRVILNYGLNKVRFPAPLRDRQPLSGCTWRSPRSSSSATSGAEVVWRLTYEVEGKPKPCCVADLVFRYYS